MNSDIILEQYEFVLMSPEAMVSAADKTKYTAEKQSPLLRVNIDFQKGKFFLDGDWNFLMAANRYALPHWHAHHKGRVNIDVSLFPSTSINLSDPYANGIILPGEGNIQDGKGLTACSGMVILDKVNIPQNRRSYAWIITFYLYDYQIEECEIKYRLPVYLSDTSNNHN